MSLNSMRLHSTDGSPSATSSQTPSDLPTEIIIDKFTNFALNSHLMPLGTMTQDQWLDVMDAIDAWLRIGGGFSVHSAECLLERLISELAATRMPWISQDRTRMLLNIHSLVCQSWLEVFRDSECNSHLALMNAERALHRLLELPAYIGATMYPVKFPLDEWIAVVGGYLEIRTEKGIEHASRLVLQITGNMYVTQLQSGEYTARLGPLIEQCAVMLLAGDSKNDLAVQLIERMNTLKESGHWPEMQIPGVAERMLLESSLDRTSESNRLDANDTGPLSSFEHDAIEKRFIDVLSSANESDDVERLVQKISKLNPSDKMIKALIEFFVRIGNAESASEWLQKLDTSYLVSSNLIESIIESWRAQPGKRTAWRADEVVKTSLSQVPVDKIKFINSRAFNKLILMWSTTDDTASDRKIVDWYSQMKAWEVQPDTATLKMILHAAVRGGFENSIQCVAEDFRNRWGSLETVDKQELVESVTQLAGVGGTDVGTISLFMDFIQLDEFLPRQQLCRTLLTSLHMDSASSSDVMKIVDFLGNSEGETDLSLFAFAIQLLFKLEERPVAEVESVYDRALDVIQKHLSDIDNNDISQFIEEVIAMLAHRKLYSEAGSCLQKAEEKLLINPKATDGISLIRLECYKKLIVRKWYTEKTAPRVERTFERLMVLYRSGYSNLQPDCETYEGYIRALTVSSKDVERPLNEMIDLYKASGLKSLVPSAEPFNAVLVSYGKGKAQTFTPGDKSIALLNRMVALGVDPNIKTFNLVLQNVTRGGNHKAYEIVSEMMGRLEACNLQPNSFTLHSILDSCGSAPPDDRDSALKKCLSTLQEIREKGYVGRATYGITSRAIYRLLNKGTRADKVAASVMSLCREDGCFDEEVRGRLQSLMSREAWEQHYTAELEPDGHEPPGWSIHVQTDALLSRETAA